MAALLRLIIMAVGTGAVVTGIQDLLDGTFKQLVFEIRDSEGVTEEDAKDIVGNILIDLAINSATVGTVIKSKIFVSVAEYFGLTSRGYVKKALVGKAAQVEAKMAGATGFEIAKKVGAKILKVLAVPGALIWLTSAVANIIEPGIYKPEQTNALYRKLGIPFQYPTSAGTAAPAGFEGTEFRKLAEAIEIAGVKGISNPVQLRSEPYTRDALADVINYVYGQQVLKGDKVTPSKILPLIQQYLIGAQPVSYSPTTTTTQATQSVSPVSTKVFTGIVSQGVVGQGLVFTPRPDDLIESPDELRQAAANNLAPFLNTLLGKIVYEVKVVSSIITKEGFKQSGLTQRIQTGTNADGSPRYKTITNKFATLTVYALTDKGVRSRLTTINLGPVNSSKFIVGINDLRSIETQLPSLVTTNKITDIQGIETSSPVTVTTPKSDSSTSEPVSYAANSGQPVQAPNTATPVTAVAGGSATTLYEWYTAQGQVLPPLEIRAQLYASFGLGQANYYTGTAEQNTKLLAALKNAAIEKAKAQAQTQAQTSKSGSSTSKSGSSTTTAPKTGNGPHGRPTKIINGQLYEQSESGKSWVKVK